MRNPWLDIPLRDYEGHMALPSIGQAARRAAGGRHSAAARRTGNRFALALQEPRVADPCHEARLARKAALPGDRGGLQGRRPSHADVIFRETVPVSDVPVVTK